MSLVLQDKSGDLEAKLWDTTDEHMKLYPASTIVKVGADVHEYRGKNQLRIKHKCPIKETENVSIPTLSLQPPPRSPVLKSYCSFFQTMENPHI